MDKHIVNHPRELAREALHGLVRSRPDLSLDNDQKIVLRKRTGASPAKVKIISGGGSGHEPSFSGLVGQGGLDAVACGNVFASPNVKQIREAVRLVSSDKEHKGVLMVIMRYTGDVLQFALTLEHSKSTRPDLPISLLIVGDDVAVPRKQGAIVGRRGLAGTVLIQKIAGALAEKGAELEEIHQGLEGLLSGLGTCGVGLGHCSVPGSHGDEEEETSAAHLKQDEIEIGMGIHNEPGVLSIPLPPANKLIPQMIEYITSTTDSDRSFVPFEHDGKDEVVLLVNNLGGMSELEMGLIVKESLGELERLNIKVRRVGSGRYMTSLNAPGFSITLLLLPRTSTGSHSLSSDAILDLLDAPLSAGGWIPLFSPRVESEYLVSPTSAQVESKKKLEREKIAFDNFDMFSKAVKSACESVIKAEPEITRFDTIAGDGDCGTCLKAGAEEILKAFENGDIDSEDVPTAVLGLAEAMERAMDGTSGALYSITFNALAAGLIQQATLRPDSSNWASALDHALETLYKYTNARPPSRTLVDPLEAFVKHFSSSQGGDLDGAIVVAREVAEKTRDLVAKAGRAAYVGQDTLREKQVPDPGAWGVIMILEGLRKGLNG